MKLLLIAPPVGNFGQAPPGISVLTAWMRHHGHECVQWDLSIEAFHYFHSRDYLNGCAQRLERRAEPVRAAGQEDLHVLALRSAESIEWAKDRLREPGVERNAGDMKRAVEIIRDAGLVLSAALNIRIGYSRFEIPGAYGSWDSLQAALCEPERNPLISYYRGCVLERLDREVPDVLGISITYLSQFLPGLTLAQLVRAQRPETKILIGGAFPTAIRADILAMPPRVAAADGLVFGDGEKPLLAYVEALARGGDPGSVPGLLRAGGDRFVPAEVSTTLRLDELPVPMLTLDGIDLDRYLVPKYPIALPLTRGCYWGKCTFCNISNQKLFRYRRRSPDLALEDMRTLAERHGTNWFDFAVDSYPPADLGRLSRAITAAGLEVEWGAEVLLDKGFTAEILADMARAGCRTLRFGLESADQEVLAAMEKRVHPPSAARILRDCRASAIKTSLMCIVGYPTETQGKLMKTIDFLLEHSADIDFVTLHQFGVVPDTPMADHPDRFGIRLLPRPGVISPSLPYENLNAVAMRPDDLPRVIEILIDRLREKFPNAGELWTSAIGGWLTFPAACANPPEFFKITPG